MSSPALHGVQRSFDDLGDPLVGVTFVVVDLETTGTSPGADGITEFGAVKLRGGECLGTFQTLVNPGMPVPPMITVLTGITEAMVIPAPPVSEVLPAFLEFLGEAVLVGHNLSFDVGFLDAAARANGYPRLANVRVDTLALARRLVLDEVPNLKLSTLSRYARVSHQPTHRALDDALATAEVLHWLLERAGSLGVTALDDLVALPTIRASAALSKLGLTRRLPRAPGVYLFRDARGAVLYVGKATDLRSRVRSYFSTETRRKIPSLFREAAAIDHIRTADPLEAEILELRLIRQHEPRYNRQARAWRSYPYLKLTLGERFPRLAVVRDARPDGALYLGPFASTGAAQTVREAVESTLPLRRCNRRIPARRDLDGAPLCTPCVSAQLGVSACPCSGLVDEAAYADVVAAVVRGLTAEPALLFDPLVTRMRALSEARRFEEAAATRERLAALARALRRQRALDMLRTMDHLVVDGRHGRVEAFRGHLTPPADLEVAIPPVPESGDGPIAKDAIDELIALQRWLDREARSGTARVSHVDGTLACRLPAIPTFEPIRRPGPRSAKVRLRPEPSGPARSEPPLRSRSGR